MTTRRRIVIALVCLTAVAIGIGQALREPELPDFLRKPAENAAYLELLKATAGVVWDTQASETNHPKMAQNEKVFADVARAMKAEVEAAEACYDLRTFDIMTFVSAKHFSYALLAKGRMAEAEKRTGDAAQAVFDAMRLGQKIEHGPLINFMIGAAIERGALKRMEGLIPGMSTNDLRKWAPEMQRLNASRIGFEEILRREEYYMARNATNIIDRVKSRFSRQTRGIVDSTRESHDNLRAQFEVLASTMAAVCYARENSKMLADMAELTPKYLRRAPVDPYGNGELRMIASTNGPVFYSVGKNRIDESAKGDDIALKHIDHTAWQVMARALSGQ